MAHYDCSNCGHTLGVSFGICERCTPKEYFKLQNDITKLKEEANDRWDTGRAVFIEEYLEEHGVSIIRNKLEEMRNDKRL
jgi:predicted ATP-dependent serine protease